MIDKSQNTLSPASTARRGNMPRLVIRVGNGTLDFLLPDAEGNLKHESYSVRSGVSMAANLRQAFRESQLLRAQDRFALISVSSPVALIPVDEYMDDTDFDVSGVYDMTFLGYESEQKLTKVLPDLGTVCVFAVNKDLKMVVEDHFTDVRIQNVMQPVWSHLYRNSMLVGRRRKLYGYFHDRHVDIFSFQQRRFRFANSFDATHQHDALYYLLFAWTQLAMNNEEDELHIVGNIEYKEWLVAKLKQHLRNVYVINPVADLNRAPGTMIKGLDYDMMF